MILKAPELLTHMDIWAPRYSSAYTDTKERVALLAQYKVAQASPVIIVVFTKAKHLVGLRYAIKRSEVEKCIIDTNGKIPCYAVPMSKLEQYETVAEVKATVNNIFKD